MISKPYFVYILRGDDGSFYTGITTDLKKRLSEHNGEKAGGAKYTATRRPWNLVYHEMLKSRSAATAREYEIKKMSREKKNGLILL